MAVWPSELVITRDGFSETPPNRVIRSDMDVGPDKVRRRSTAAVRELKLKLFLTDSLMDIFDDFYLDNDSTVFEFTHPRTSATVNARFNETPTYSLRETYWDVNVSLEILP